MTIKELIDELSKYPDDTVVKYPGPFDDWDIVVVCKFDGYDYILLE